MIPKRNHKPMLLMLIMVLILGNYLQVNAQPQITSISTSQSAIVSASGSIEGGTYVYIKGSGFSTDASENIITFGPYPCNLLASGARQNSLACQTTRAYDPNNRWGLPVSVEVKGNQKLTCTLNQCRFSFTEGKTPFIEEVHPRTAVGDQEISIWGKHRITDPGDQRSNGAGQIVSLKVDDKTCSTLDVVQEDAVNPNDRDYLRCKVFKDQEAGQYGFTEQVEPGLARYDIRSVQTSHLTGKNYTERVAPKITTVPFHLGGNKGHEIEIKGSGFSKNAQNYVCKIAGQDCTVKDIDTTKLTVVVPPLDAGNTAFGALPKDVTENGTQELKYLGSNGFKYTRYTIDSWKSTADWFTVVRAANVSLVVESSQIRTELRSVELIESKFLEYWRGYFYAPVSGEYRFAGIADDGFEVQLSSVQNSANLANLQTLISNSYSDDNFNPYFSGQASAIANKTLTQGYYYVEIVNFNWGGAGDFRVLVDMPQLHNYTANPTWQVDEVILLPETITPEIVEIKITKTAIGSSINFAVTYFESAVVKYTAMIPYGATADRFKSQLGNLPYYGNYNPTVTLITKDRSGAVTSNSTSIDSYTYRISWERYRNPITLLREFYSDKATFIRVQNHSKPITGTYSIKLDGNDLKIWSNTNNNYSVTAIPYNTQGWQLQNAFNAIYQTDKIKVRIMKDADFDQNIKFVIEYVGVLATPLPITVATTGLLGGNANIFTKNVTVKRAFSLTRPLYSPLPFDFMRTAESNPQLYLKVNGIPTVCDSCHYNFNASKTPTVTAASLSADTLSFSVTDVGAVGFALSDLKITLNGERCNSITGTLGSMTCKFAQNSAGNAALPSDTNKPIVHIAQVGYANTGSISAITVPMVVSSITPSSIGMNGGLEGTIIGKGFPMSGKTGVTLNLCGNPVTEIISISNEQIKFIIPKAVTTCTSARLLQTGTSSVLQIGTTQQPITPSQFNYSAGAPSITSLSKTSSSPIIKTTLIITGTGFSTVAGTKVFLVNGAGFRSYELTVVTVTTTQVECILGGGKTGNYSVVVLDSTTGESTVTASSSFNYELIVDSISPTSGGLGGGYDITITGRNFGAADSHTVFVGNAQNTVCTMKSATATTIVCTVPRMDSSYTPGTPVNVVVTGRLLEESICKGSCGFTYDPAVTNNVTVPTTLNYDNGQTVTITGSNLSGATVKVGTTAVNLTAANSTSISFVYPALKYGSYEVAIMTSTGLTHPAIITTTNLWITSGISRSSGSLNGHQLTVSGNGFPSTVDQLLSVTEICGLTVTKLQVIAVVPNQVTFETIPSPTPQSCKINVTYETTFKVFGYDYLTSQTHNSTITQGASNTFTISASTTVNTVTFQYLNSQNAPTSTIYAATLIQTGTNTYTATPVGGYLPNGKFKILVHTTFFGYHTVNPTTFTKSWSSNPTFTAGVSSSFVGGKQITLTGAGFLTQKIQNNQIQVCGLKATIKSATSSALTLSVPPFVTTVTQGLYNLAKPDTIIGSVISDSPSQKSKSILDGNVASYYSSANTNCFIGFNFGSNARASIQFIKYMPNPQWAIAAQFLEGAKFEGSNDNTTWTQLFTVDTKQVHSGWNYWAKPSGSTIMYQYVRFSHSNVSKCQLSQLQMNGIVYSTSSVTAGVDKQCDIVIKGPTDVTLANAVTYSHAKTSTITSLTPKFGPSVGGTVLTITGTNFGTTLSVTIDGIVCSITANTATSITCTTGRRATIPNANSFLIVSDGNPVLVLSEPFNYIDRWSSQDTWGGQSLPRAGDSVYVPKGMSLLVDVDSTPILDSIIVEGRIQFSDEKDMTIDAHYFIISSGEFIAGTETNRYQKKLTITLHGGFYDKQLPIFGNKVLGCRNCKFSLHGQLRTPTWTELKTTVAAGATSLEVMEPVDWRVGESIVVASSSFDHYESQQMTIASVSANKTVITVTQPFKYRHFAAVQTYGTTDFPMRAEVGLLTRNIKIQGDDSSVASEYGSHMMMNGKKANGLVASFSYVEITKCGQPRIIGRYCSHFHMTGEMPESSVRGMAVHHSYARVLTIHGTHFLTVEKNVGYYVKGHNIFIEDGIETNNVIQDNLMISTITSFTMLQSDTSVASYWITNPYNTVRRNHAAGSDFYGFWYEIKEHPDGPSSTSDICPMGMQVGESKDNVAHSNVRFGLRIFKLSARNFPCIPTQDDGLLDPYTANVAIESVFENYTLWKNAECGFLGEQLGFTTIKNFKIVDSKKGGMQFHKTNYTKELVVAKDSIIVGFSRGNSPATAAQLDAEYNQARGFIASRTDGLKASGIQFYNFGSTMTPLQSCSECYNMKLWVVGSKTTFFENISYSNVSGNYIFWEKWRRQVFIDLDGTLLTPAVTALGIAAQSKGSITPYRASVMIPNHCYEITGSVWDHSTYCDSTVTLRSILFTNAIPSIDFNAINIKAHRLDDPLENFTITNPAETTFSEEYMIIIKKMSLDIKNSWAMPFVVGSYYNIHWKWGIDFMHLAIAPSRLWTDTQGVVLRFNYTDTRQLFEIGKWYKAQLQLPFIVPSNNMILPTTCQNGDYYNDPTARYLFICVSGRNKAIHEWIDVNGIRCRYNCPQDNGDGVREDKIRLWSDTSNWPNGVLPQEGENVTIPYAWKMVVNVDVPILNYLQVNGILMFDINMNHTFEAHYIWVRKGQFKIGTPDAPYINQAKIILHGQKDDRYLVLDPDASGNKILAVTGSLQLYGKPINNAWTKLTKIAAVGATTIDVVNSADWNVGDKIVIGPTYAGSKQDQVVTITAINGNTISFDTPLVYEHYGAPASITNKYGVLDTRAGVGLLSRNIKITKGPDANGWGCRVLAYSYSDFDPANPAAGLVNRTGSIIFDGVEVDSCGQYDTSYAGVRFDKLGNFENNWKKPSLITRSSFHNSNGMAMWVANTTNIKIDNNVFYYAKKFLIYAEFVNNYTVTNNLLIGARARPEILEATTQTFMVDDVSCYEQYTEINYDTDNVTVTNNLAQGSQKGQGFVFPFAPCDKLDTYNFGGNTAGSCTVGFMFQLLTGFQCIGASKMVGYANQIGLMANPPTSSIKLVYQDVIFTDNQRGITLRYANDVTDDNTVVLKNSYFAGFSRPDCPNCYSNTKLKYCRNGYAIRMFAATIGGETFPLKKKNTGFDVICNRQAYDMKSFFDNVTFQNYKDTNPSVPYCTDMSVFRRHNLASDNTASVYLTNSPCINCEQNAWGWFEKPNAAWFGWFGGCGQMECTGPSNYIIYDQDGSFTGRRSQILANNSMIGDKEPSCTFNQKMNGYYCLTEELAVMEYESIAPDFNQRIMWPVSLKYDTGPWESKTNGWREWEWDGPEPMNKRLARFVSVVKLHQNYNLTYAGQPPSDTRFQIQKRLLPTGNASDWVIIRIYYPLPNSLEVLVKNTTGTDILIKPFAINNGEATDLRNYVDVCGANNFHYGNGTIEFVLNGKNNCQVRVRLSNFIKLSARLSIPVMSFYNNNGPTTFITNICAFLGIDPGRLKIVGVRNGSIIVESIITTPTPALSQSTVASTTTDAQIHADLSAMAAKLSSSLSSGLIDVGAPVLGVSTQVGVISQNGQVYVPPTVEQKDQNRLIMIIVLSTVVPIVVILMIVSGYCYMKRKRERISTISNESDVNISDEKSDNKKREMIKVSEIPFEISKMSDTFNRY